MINEIINLREKEINGFMPTLTTYIMYDPQSKQDPNRQSRKRPAVIICPGGGYEFCSPREAEPVAMQFCAAGIQAFVLDYCVSPIRYPEALTDASEAIKTVRKNADKWDIDPDKIAVCGFSAGGHLAASIGTLWNSEPAIKCSNRENMPNAMILSYPVIIWGDKTHKGSFYALLGNNLSDTEYSRMSLEKRVSSDTPPAFLWHTFTDTCVPVENSLEFADALREHDIPFEMHIYPEGNHGLSLVTKEVCDEADINPHTGTWIKLACEWLESTFK